MLKNREESVACAVTGPKPKPTALPLRPVPELTEAQKGYLSIRPMTLAELDKALAHIQIKTK